jgi:cob(I)alamin adenosyltransferase
LGNRLSKLVTKTGDDGTTGISNNKRLAKDSERIEAIGTIDELNSSIGMVLSQPIDDDIANVLNQVQHRLFDMGGELAMPEYELVKQEHLQALDKYLVDFNDKLPPLKEFILPKGNLATACCHMARTICRRAERRMVTLARQERINETAQVYLNRLSDLLFVFCRMLAKSSEQSEEMWNSQRE